MGQGGRPNSLKKGGEAYEYFSNAIPDDRIRNIGCSDTQGNEKVAHP